MALKLTCCAALALLGSIGCTPAAGSDAGATTAGTTTTGGTTTGTATGGGTAGATSGGGTTGATNGGTTGASTGGTSGTIAVNGTVEFFHSNAPASGIVVVLSSGGATIDGGLPSTISAADGTFHFASVTPPYDLALVDNAAQAYGVYQGLSRADPFVISPNLNGGPSFRHAAISGAVTTPACLPSGQVIEVCYGLGDHFSAPLGGVCTTASASGTYSLNFDWGGASPMAGNLYALQMDQDGGVATGYPGFAKIDSVSVASGDALMGENLFTAGPLGTAVLTGTVSAPAWITVYPGHAVLNMDGQAPIPLGYGDSSTDIRLLVPVIPGGTYGYEADGVLPGASVTFVGRNLDPATSFNITVPTPAVQVLPADGATDVNNATPFTWSPLPGSVYFVAIFPQTPGLASFVMFTTATSMSLADFTAGGSISFSPSADNSWEISSLGPWPGTDAVAGPDGPFAQSLNSDYFIGSSFTRPFTMAPQ